MRLVYTLLSPALVWALSACAVGGEPTDYGDPTELATPTEIDGIVAWVEEPILAVPLETPTPEVVIRAYLPGDDVPLNVRVSRLTRDGSGNNQVADTWTAVREGKGEKQLFRVQVGLLHGSNRLQAHIETPDQARVRRLEFSLHYDGQAPGLSLSLRARSRDAGPGEPCDDTEALALGLTNARTVCVIGRATTADGSSARVSLKVSGGGSSDVNADGSSAFESTLDLRADRTETITATAVDGAGNQTTVQTEVVQDSTPPRLKLAGKARETSAPVFEIEGTASDAWGVAVVELESGGQTELQATTPASWEFEIPLSPGEHTFALVARDRAGNETRLPLVLSRLRTLWLGPPNTEAGATEIEIGRDEIDSLLTQANQESIELVSIDVEPTVKQALLRIREPERYGVDTTEWGAPERNLQRILAMTADNADLSGTTLEELLMISDGLGLPSPRVLSQLLDLDVTTPIIDLDALAAVVMDQLVGTHPNIGFEGATPVIEVSLYDVQQDLRTLAPRFGPDGSHPGFLAGESSSPVLEPGFRLTLPVESNLVQYDAVDLSRATKDYHFLVEGDRVLDFNILTDSFDVVGLQDQPTVDLRFVLDEHPGPGMLQAGTDRTARPDVDDPGFFRGDGEGWGVDPWLFERVAVEAAYRVFHRRYESDGFQRTLRYDTGAITDAAVVDWDRGWVTISTAGGLGSPPAPVYVWDFIKEVAQVRLHDGDLAEGEANMAFTLTDVPIGLEADELVEKLRPSLHEQEEELSDQVVGELGLAEPRADLFFIAPDGGKGDGALAFRAEDDSDADYPYASPGFFSDPGLTKKVSATDPTGGVGATLHEKVPARLGVTYYAADETGVVYAIKIVEREGSRIGLQVATFEEAVP